MASGPTTAERPAGEPSHGKIVVIAWIVLSLIATPLVAIYLGPIIPPGNGSAQATEQGSAADGPPLRNNSRVQFAWVVTTSAMVLALAAFGTFELLQTGSGGGQGPSPIAYPANHHNAFEVQVIGQQWQFTYRYPSLGDMESNQLMLPANTTVVFHVTSLDVVHSFWAVELGVKADANPGIDNVAYVETKSPMTFHVRCAELCGLWHGYMFNNGRVVDSAQFQSWAKQAELQYAPIAKYVPAYSHTYFPDPQRRAG
jgi:cytochrome c oxidase subunit 2